MLYQYPKQAYFGRVLPKSKIYQHGSGTNGSANKGISSAIKQLFVDQVEQIKWNYKLAANTLNMAASPKVPEIQVLRIRLKKQQLNHKVLSAIDQAITFPIIFELERTNLDNSEQFQVKVCAAYKIQGFTSEIAVDDYLSTDWHDETLHSMQPLPIALNLASLYEQILTPLILAPKRDGERFTDLLVRSKAIHTAQKQLEKVRTKLNQERQFNRKVALNQDVRDLIHCIKQLTV
jgi:hypothetical protein